MERMGRSGVCSINGCLDERGGIEAAGAELEGDYRVQIIVAAPFNFKLSLNDYSLQS